MRMAQIDRTNGDQAISILGRSVTSSFKGCIAFAAPTIWTVFFDKILPNCTLQPSCPRFSGKGPPKYANGVRSEGCVHRAKTRPQAGAGHRTPQPFLRMFLQPSGA